MQYKIIVDKQSRTNPSDEKREYIVDIEELRAKGVIHDSLIITRTEDYVIRRLSLSEYKVLTVLDTPKKEPIPDLNIELFEGDNYIYLMDLEGNKFYAEYLVKNDFTDLYVTESQLTSSIEQFAGDIMLSVQGTFATKKDLESSEKTLSASIELKINKKDLISEINASADRITLNAGRLVITAGNFQLDDKGNITAIGGTIGGFTLSANKFSATINGAYNYNLYDVRNVEGCIVGFIDSSSFRSLYDFNSDGVINIFDEIEIIKKINGTSTINKNVNGTLEVNTNNVKDCITIKQNGNLAVSIGVGGVNTYLLSAENIICSSNNSTSDSTFRGIAINGSSNNPQIIVTDGTESNTSYITADSITTPKINAENLSEPSLLSKKKNIQKLNIDAISLVKKADICIYNYKKEKKGTKKHIGLVIGEGYNCPDLVISDDGQGIEQYSYTSLLYKAFQQLLERVEKLEGVK